MDSMQRNVAYRAQSTIIHQAAPSEAVHQLQTVESC